MDEHQMPEEKLLAQPQNRELEVQELRRELRRVKREADAASRAKSQFLANMSHEIRTPMAAILGYLDLMIEDGDLSRAPASRIEYIRTIRRNSHYLLRILNDILDLSKVESGELDVERIPVPLRQIVDDVATIVRESALEKGLCFEVLYRGLVPERIQTDPTRLRQILTNLLVNAVKFTSEGGVLLSVQLVNASLETPVLQFTIADTGIGLSPTACSVIFDAFTQADSSTSRRFGGTGLGLAISRQLAQFLGGELRVESMEGVGSSFLLSIDPGSLEGVPLTQPTSQDETLVTLGELPTAACVEWLVQHESEARILIVEDGEDNRRLVTFMLQRVGFRTSHAENGEEGVDAALAAHEAGEPFDVVLMDMQMPVLDGYDATRKLREAKYDRPIIALTAHAMKGDREKCLAVGCDDFVTKPINRRQLVNKILTHLGKR